MANDKGKQDEERKQTEYRVFKLQSDGPLDAAEDGPVVEMHALLPDVFTGNAVKAAAEKYGVGTYIAVPKASAKPRVAEIPTPKLRVR